MNIWVQKYFLLLLLSLMVNKKSRSKRAPPNLLNNFIIFHPGLHISIITLHVDLQTPKSTLWDQKPLWGRAKFQNQLKLKPFCRTLTWWKLSTNENPTPTWESLRQKSPPKTIIPFNYKWKFQNLLRHVCRETQ